MTDPRPHSSSLFSILCVAGNGSCPIQPRVRVAWEKGWDSFPVWSQQVALRPVRGLGAGQGRPVSY